jgi:hypothetical protein
LHIEQICLEQILLRKIQLKQSNWQLKEVRILKFLKVSGFDVEIDIRVFDGDRIWLGHDAPQYAVSLEFLQENSDRLWVHCKNTLALKLMLEHNFNCFWHQDDDYTLTSFGLIWAYPGKELVKEQSVCVLPEWERGATEFKDWKDCYAICTDYPEMYKKMYLDECSLE